MNKLVEAELKKVQQYAVDVTLDPDIAHPNLILSEDGKQVSHGGVRKNLPDNPERFFDCICVLGKQSFSSRKFYFEVQVKGKTEWDLGVARESVNRKEDTPLSPDTGYWTIWLRNGNEYEALDDPDVSLSLKSRPQKVGVFVDYEEGLVSFYDVDAAALIYSFTGCSFREKLFPSSQLNRKASSSSSEQQVSKPGEVPCDVCTGTKLKALKSCLVCLVSYCKIHLEPHLTVSGLKRHQLMEPVENLEGRMCTKHDKPLELFCKTDQTCVCMLCSVLDHKTHECVPLREEYEGKKAELGKTEAEIQQMIQKRRLKIEEIKRSVDLTEEDADREIAEGVQVFTSLKDSVERGLNELIHTIKEKKETTEKQAQAFIKELEQEISELMKRRTEVEELSQSEDHLRLLQSVQSLNIHHPPPTKDWTEVSVRPSYDGTVRRAVTQLEETLSKEMKKLVAKSELKKVQQYAVDVTLHPDTAHPNLILSEDGKQSLSSGRFYFEVLVKGKTEWDLGVARESIDRKGKITLSPQKGEKVGVFVDYEEGLVSFYDVDAAALIYSFTGCSFREKLFPYVCPGLYYGGKNSAPLIISPVNLSFGLSQISFLGLRSIAPLVGKDCWSRPETVNKDGRRVSTSSRCTKKNMLDILAILSW
ncbi:hypothetical protein L3Q82_005553 [Scortum barcoo]|uniref:Uncharacterized protein n=1 Tax=Scortum barcoo TaxID=214431 RepID=A0ACB8VAR3_9TELE|nr:hypothetical protein L3Q82_005553 [Scortum barcoo]